VVAALLLASCGGGEDGLTPGGADAVLTIEEALVAEDGQAVRVEGALLFTETRTVLASAMLESYPPQAGGAVIPVEGLDPASVVGLNSTAPQPDLAQVSWTDYRVVLEGVVEDGVLKVSEPPPAVEASAGGLRVRFCPPGEASASGDTVWWVFDVTNTGSSPVDLTFASGQTGEVVLSRDGIEEYRWSDGKVFTQAVSTLTLGSGQTVVYQFNDVVGVAAGEYELTATVTATVGQEGSATVLPVVRTTLRVR
jgi:hypothetical protein